MDLNASDYQKSLNIQVLDDFKELWQNGDGHYREIIYYGGRFGGKNRAVADFLGVKGLESSCKILILREFQTSGKNSVYADLKDFFQRHDIEFVLESLNLDFQRTRDDKFVKYKADKITLLHNATEFIFAGINDNTCESLKGLNDIKYCWLDEAEFITQYAYSVLEPTIRAENSFLIWTFNPKNSDSFLYQRVLNNQSKRVFCKKINAVDLKGGEVVKLNPFLSDTNFEGVKEHLSLYSLQYWRWAYLGEPYDVEDGNIIPVDKIGFFDDSTPQNYERLIMTADTAFSKKENADFSVICVFGKKGDEIHLLRLFRGHWDFNELREMSVKAYEWALSACKQNIETFIIEKKASGISLLQELQRLTHLPVKEIVPKKDKFTRISSVLTDFARLRLPLNKENPLNSWIDEYLHELKAFRADEKHLHDDMVDATYYALDYFEEGTDWAKFLQKV